MSDFLLTPYNEPNVLNEAQLNFNNHLRVSRQPVAKAFRLLKQRFRQLSRLDFHQVDTAAKFVISCCVLHNLCTAAGDPLYIEDDVFDGFEGETSSQLYADLCSELSEPLELNPDELQSKQLGEIKRDRISTDLLVKSGLANSFV